MDRRLLLFIAPIALLFATGRALTEIDLPSCPDGYLLVGDGDCKERCPNDTFPTDDSCVQCPLGTQYVHGRCLSCNDTTMVLKNGRCTCPPRKAFLNGECVTVDIVACGHNEIFINGKCAPQYCYGAKCCKDTFCNSCFDTCAQLHLETGPLSECQRNCIEGVAPSLPPKLPEINTNNNNNDPCMDTCDQPMWCSNYVNCSQQSIPVWPEIQAPQNETIVLPAPDLPPTIITVPRPINPPQYIYYNNQPNSGDTINITNIINDTNVVDVPTAVNNTNVNDMTLGSDSERASSPQASQVIPENDCCVITGPRKCVQVDNGNTKCYRRRRHECGEACKNQAYQNRYPMMPQFYAPPPPTYGYLPPAYYQPPPQMPCAYQNQWPFVNCGQN